MLKEKACQETFYDNYVRENFIPPNHKYVKIKSLINVDFIPALVRDTYKNKNRRGNDSIDPRTLFLMCLVGFIEDYSDYDTVEKITETPVLKWFVGLTPSDKVPDETTIVKFRNERMGEQKFKESFYKILNQIKDMGLINGQIQSQDTTHLLGNVARIGPFQLVNKCRLRLLKAVKDIDEKKYEELLEKYDFELLQTPPNKQEHFEKLIETTNKLAATVKKSKELKKNETIKYELGIVDRVLEEREDEYYDSEGNKQQKDDIEKKKGKMVNPSDPDVVYGAKSKKKIFAGYKAEIELDHLYDFITAIDVIKGNEPDEWGAAALLKEQQKYLGITPAHFLADAKYSFGITRAEIMAVGVPNLYIPEAHPKHRNNKMYSSYLFNWNWQLMNLVCPADYPSEAMFPNDEKLGFEFVYNKEICDECELKKDCTGSFTGGRRVLISHNWWDHKEGFRIMLTPEYKIMYNEQRYKIERKNADVKRWHGFEKARYRGLSRVRIQAYLTAIAANLKKWVKFTTGKLKNGIDETLSKLAAIRPHEDEVCLNTC